MKLTPTQLMLTGKIALGLGIGVGTAIVNQAAKAVRPVKNKWNAERDRILHEQEIRRRVKEEVERQTREVESMEHNPY
jgi:hypothetical protein